MTTEAHAEGAQLIDIIGKPTIAAFQLEVDNLIPQGRFTREDWLNLYNTNQQFALAVGAIPSHYLSTYLICRAHELGQPEYNDGVDKVGGYCSNARIGMETLVKIKGVEAAIAAHGSTPNNTAITSAIVNYDITQRLPSSIGVRTAWGLEPFPETYEELEPLQQFLSQLEVSMVEVASMLKREKDLDCVEFVKAMGVKQESMDRLITGSERHHLLKHWYYNASGFLINFMPGVAGFMLPNVESDHNYLQRDQLVSEAVCKALYEWADSIPEDDLTTLGQDPEKMLICRLGWQIKTRIETALLRRKDFTYRDLQQVMTLENSLTADILQDKQALQDFLDYTSMNPSPQYLALFDEEFDWTVVSQERARLLLSHKDELMVVTRKLRERQLETQSPCTTAEVVHAMNSVASDRPEIPAVTIDLEEENNT